MNDSFVLQELEDSLERYHELYDDNQKLSKQFQSEIAELKQQQKPSSDTDDSPRNESGNFNNFRLLFQIKYSY